MLIRETARKQSNWTAMIINRLFIIIQHLHKKHYVGLAIWIAMRRLLLLSFLPSSNQINGDHYHLCDANCGHSNPFNNSKMIRLRIGPPFVPDLESYDHTADRRINKDVG